MRLYPTPTPRAQSTVPPAMAPECETNPMWPGLGIAVMKVVSSGTCVSITPTQFGPIRRML